MKFVFQPKDPMLPLLAIGVLLASFLMLAINPAHAATPTVNNTASNLCTNSLTCNIALTVSTTGDVVAVIASIENTGTSGTLYTITGVTSTGVSGGFSEIISVNAQCTSSVGFCNGAGGQPEWMFTDAWVGVATSSGAITIVVTGSSAATSTSGGEAFDISNSATSPAHYGTGSCNAVSGNDCANPIVSASASNPVVASVYLTGAITLGAGISSTPPLYYTYVGTGNGQKLGGGYAPNTLVPPTSYPINLNGGSGLNTGYALVGLTFNTAAATTVTTTNNTNCLGGCSGGANSTSTYFSTAMPSLFVFYASQNTASSGQIDNFTMKIHNVKINANSGFLLVGVYTPSTPTTIPSGGNQYVLAKSVVIPITNTSAGGGSDYFIHANPQANICSSCYYAVGILANTTASRGGGTTGSGVSFYETSQTGITQYSFNPGSGALPASFYSGTIKKPNFFMFIHETYTVSSTTVTSTLTLSGLVTSTTSTTVTSTVTTIDSTFFTQNANFPFMVLILLLPTGIFLGITRNLSGGLVGLLIGAVIGAFTQVIPSWIFTGLVIAIVASAFMIQRSSRNG